MVFESVAMTGERVRPAEGRCLYNSVGWYIARRRLKVESFLLGHEAVVESRCVCVCVGDVTVNASVGDERLSGAVTRACLPVCLRYTF